MKIALLSVIEWCGFAALVFTYGMVYGWKKETEKMSQM